MAIQKLLGKIIPPLLLVVLVQSEANACEWQTNATENLVDSTISHFVAPTSGVADLPHSQGRLFYTLDDYLLYLEEMGKQDRPYYVRIGPDLYRLEAGRGGGGQSPQYFTRDELQEKFGF